MTLFRQFVYKKFGILPFETLAGEVNQEAYHPYIRILFLRKGVKLPLILINTNYNRTHSFLSM
jgi:hypothetical protein